MSDTENKKNILWLSHFVPYPPKGGAFQRSFNLIKLAAKYNNIYLIAVKHKSSTHPTKEEGEAKEALGQYCKEVIILDVSKNFSGFSSYLAALKNLLSRYSMTVGGYELKELHQAIANMLNKYKFDMAYYDAISLVGYVKDIGLLPKVLGHMGAEGLMIRRRIKREPKLIKRIYFWYEAIKLTRDERINCPQFDTNIVVSELDRSLLKSVAPKAKFELVENGVDTDFFASLPQEDTAKRILFAGRLDQYSNRDGITWFCREMWPKLKDEFPSLQFIIIGNNPSNELMTLAKNDENVELLGFVDDVRPYFSKASICVTPLRTGGGTRMKVLDALAMAKPVVSTSIAAEGIDIKNEHDILLANTPEEYVEQIKRLFNDSQLREKLAKNARITIENKYAWPIIGKNLNNIFNSVIQK